MSATVCSKNNHDTTDFYLGGRKLGPLVTAMSAEASDMSSWLLMGLPGLAYLTGIADAGMDCHRTRHRNVHKLEDRSKTDPPLHSRSRQFDHASFFFQ